MYIRTHIHVYICIYIYTHIYAYIYIYIYKRCCSVLRCISVYCNVPKPEKNERLPSATHCNTLQHTASHCNTLQHTATHCNTLQHVYHQWTEELMQYAAVCCNVLQYAAVWSSVLQCVAVYRSSEKEVSARPPSMVVQKLSTYCVMSEMSILRRSSASPDGASPSTLSSLR